MQEGCKYSPILCIYAPKLTRNCILDTDFVALGADNASWNVIRSEFDHILYKHAEECGALVFDETKVTAIHFEDETTTSCPRPRTNSNGSTSGRPGVDEFLGRPTSASYLTTCGQRGEIKFDYLIDASGRAGMISTKYALLSHSAVFAHESR